MVNSVDNLRDPHLSHSRDQIKIVPKIPLDPTRSSIEKLLAKIQATNLKNLETSQLNLQFMEAIMERILLLQSATL